MLIVRPYILLLLLVSTLGGCKFPALRPGKSPLTPARMSSDSIVLEMFFVRFPFGDVTANETLWEEIDEQQFSPDLRRRLAENGFRIGVIEGQMPVELSKLLELNLKPDEEAEEGSENKTEVTKIESFDEEPRVVHRRLQIRPGQRSEIIASAVYDELPVLMCSSGQLSGQTYNQAQGMFEVKSHPQPDGRVRIELVPELHHDQPRQRWVGRQGMLRLDTSRPKQVYEDLKMATKLAPGGMLILGSLPNRPGSLGHHFFTEKQERLDQKLLVIRLSQTQQDGLFNPPEPLDLSEQTP